MVLEVSYFDGGSTTREDPERKNVLEVILQFGLVSNQTLAARGNYSKSVPTERTAAGEGRLRAACGSPRT